MRTKPAGGAGDRQAQISGRLHRWAQALKREVLTVWLAARDPRVPRPVKLLALLVAGYALSPIDLVPDFIPVLGYLDDLLLVPLGIWLVVRLLPADLLAELRREAASRTSAKPRSALGAALIIALWAVILALIVVEAARWLPLAIC